MSNDKMRAAQAAPRPAGEYPPLPKHLMDVDRSDDDTFGALTEHAWDSDFARDLNTGAPLFTVGQMRAYVDADRVARAAQAQEAPSDPEAVAKIGKGPVASFVHLTDAGRALPPGRYELYARPAPASAQAAVPIQLSAPVRGVGRLDDYDSALAVYFTAVPSDNDLRALHDALTAAPSTQQGGGE